MNSALEDLFTEADLCWAPKTPLRAPKVEKAKQISLLRTYPPIWYI